MKISFFKKLQVLEGYFYCKKNIVLIVNKKKEEKENEKKRGKKLFAELCLSSCEIC